MELTFITSHPLKAEQLSLHLGHPVKHLKLDLDEIQSLDVEEVVRHKALEAYSKAQVPVLVEDVSYQYTALGKLPGPLFKWFLKELKVQGLCKLLDHYDDRSATVQVAFALTTDGKQVHTFLGEMKGMITSEPRGENGFGADSIFIPEGWNRTWGEMTVEEQVESSVRRIGLKKLESFLNALV
jgi:non-canonical purine NTP pyrophosphatase (RdgB/HAM1 family)